MTDTRKAQAEVTLSWPIPLEGGGELNRLTFRRPKGKVIKRALALVGPELINQLAGADDLKTLTSEKATDLAIKAFSRLVSAEALDELSAIIGDLCGQSGAVIDEVDPDDYPAIFGALAGFFPSLFSAGETSPQT